MFKITDMIRGTVICSEISDFIIAFNQIGNIPDIQIVKIENALQGPLK